MPDERDVAPLKASIVVLTFNGEEFLSELLDACVGQQAPFAFEILVIDSGSSDLTLSIVDGYPVRLHRIPNAEFGHGRTRNLAVRLTSGEIVVFLTQDATPVDQSWLATMVAPLQDEASLAGVFARQVPRPGCGPAGAREVETVFRRPPPGFFSNVCSAIRRSVLAQVPFRDVEYAEDRAFAADAQAAGFTVAYVPEAAVWHSHDLRLGDYFRRMYDEARGVAHTAERRPHTGVFWLVGATGLGTLRDWRYVLRSDSYNFSEKAGWMGKAPAYNASRRVAIWLAGRKRLPGDLGRTLSLDARRRKTARVR